MDASTSLGAILGTTLYCSLPKSSTTKVRSIVVGVDSKLQSDLMAPASLLELSKMQKIKSSRGLRGRTASDLYE